ncbi:hypothetical protein SLEP1_g54706 [Rubroshorea leprosula]|uniref:Uncharacterized protein n=1 Tax=Rubroshorea leprosula TaxID=152421 RepID=A0AAV5MHA6_9ROSI|nr:hypothetical protein SLEP1_g54706 [Rubroshorea leprosula]
MGGRATDLLTSGWVGLHTWASTIGEGLTSISAVPSFEIALFPVSATAFFFICSDPFGFLIHQFLNYSKMILLRLARLSLLGFNREPQISSSYPG